MHTPGKTSYTFRKGSPRQASRQVAILAWCPQPGQGWAYV